MNKDKPHDESQELLKTIFNVPFTFSSNCRSGLVSFIPGKKCNCERCRKTRGEDVTEESKKLAGEQAVKADNDHRLYRLVHSYLTDIYHNSRYKPDDTKFKDEILDIIDEINNEKFLGNFNKWISHQREVDRNTF